MLGLTRPQKEAGLRSSARAPLNHEAGRYDRLRRAQRRVRVAHFHTVGPEDRQPMLAVGVSTIHASAVARDCPRERLLVRRARKCSRSKPIGLIPHGISETYLAHARWIPVGFRSRVMVAAAQHHRSG